MTDQPPQFRRQELVRFQHCDPAGIVFYPRYVEMVNATVEDWFAAAIGVSFAEMHMEMGVATPAATLKLDFLAPSRLGEVLDFDVRIDRLGRSSVTLDVTARCDKEDRFVSTIVLVYVTKPSLRPAPWPDRFRSAMMSLSTPD